ncbi:interferon alpha-inducible protein 27-like protein 2 isoform X2 [Sus scrofa]|uniref:interferon alpha-inducible protein 27-like protein 2 isoform X2 n=1 Tax=Sus scrofa TaxID=9823 RepID=UPI000A2B5EA0|nr:interferon alpha-inducible protein 27-like protein 2 isoform X2 [Sus scrofa]
MMKRAAAAAIGGALAVGAVPVVLGALGFTGAGIAASSLAAKMMSAAAVANGGGVAAGSLVATLQSVGAAGLSTSSNILLGSVGSAFGAWLGGTKKVPPSPPPAEPRAEGGQPGEDVSQAEPPNPPSSRRSLRNKVTCPFPVFVPGCPGLML